MKVCSVPVAFPHRLRAVLEMHTAVVVFIVLVSGTIAAIGSKTAYQMKVAGQDGDVHKCVALSCISPFERAPHRHLSAIISPRVLQRSCARKSLFSC